MSSTCSGPMTTPSTAPPLIAGFFRFLTWFEISLASSAIPSPPQAIAEGPSRYFDRPSIPSSVKARRASEFLRIRSRIDFLRRSRRSWNSPTASRSLRSRISTDRVPFRSALIWSIISSLTYLLIAVPVGSRGVFRAWPGGVAIDRLRQDRGSGRGPDPRAHGGRDGDRADVGPLGCGGFE